jgi:hypothetical protein
MAVAAGLAETLRPVVVAADIPAAVAAVLMGTAMCTVAAAAVLISVHWRLVQASPFWEVSGMEA